MRDDTKNGCIAVADTDLQITGEGCHPDPEMGGGGAGLKNFFSALRASVWSKNKREAGLPGPLPPDPPLHWLVRIV